MALGASNLKLNLQPGALSLGCAAMGPRFRRDYDGPAERTQIPSFTESVLSGS
jgi:hypothetical protein